MNALSARFSTIKDFLATQHWPNAAQLKNLVSWNYYTAPIPPGGSPFILLTTTIIVLIIAGLFVWWWRVRQLNKTAPVYGLLLDQIPTIIIFLVIISIFYGFCWAEQVQYLSSRLVPLTTLLLTLGWTAYLVIYSRRILPRLLQQQLEKDRFFRYLPKKKKNA